MTLSEHLIAKGVDGEYANEIASFYDEWGMEGARACGVDEAYDADEIEGDIHEWLDVCPVDRWNMEAV